MVTGGRIVFLDTETDSLDRRTRRIWDLAYIIREPGKPDVERQWFMDIPLHRADPMSLRVGGYWERHPDPYGDLPGKNVTYSGTVAVAAARDLHGATIVGACPSFDEETLARMLHRHGQVETWSHRLLDVGTLVAGWLAAIGRPGPDGADTPREPLSLDKAAAACGLQWPEGSRHTALGDARMVRDVYDKVMGLR